VDRAESRGCVELADDEADRELRIYEIFDAGDDIERLTRRRVEDELLVEIARVVAKDELLRTILHAEAKVTPVRTRHVHAVPSDDDAVAFALLEGEWHAQLLAARVERGRAPQPPLVAREVDQTIAAQVTEPIRIAGVIRRQLIVHRHVVGAGQERRLGLERAQVREETAQEEGAATDLRRRRGGADRGVGRRFVVDLRHDEPDTTGAEIGEEALRIPMQRATGAEERDAAGVGMHGAHGQAIGIGHAELRRDPAVARGRRDQQVGDLLRSIERLLRRMHRVGMPEIAEVGHAVAIELAVLDQGFAGAHHRGRLRLPALGVRERIADDQGFGRMAGTDAAQLVPTSPHRHSAHGGAVPAHVVGALLANLDVGEQARASDARPGLVAGIAIWVVDGVRT
jgi:hypothetical protein